VNIEELSSSVARWAAAQPLVAKAHVFGSRVKGTDSPSSDLDVAVELYQQPGDETALATWICEAVGLRESLGRALPVPLDLQWYGGPQETPTIHAALLCAGRAVYSACAEPTASGGSVFCTHSIPHDG
jgi:predicted nucleotidyltransferase